MRAIITTIVLAITMLYTASAQSFTDHGDWSTGLAGEKVVALTFGEKISGNIKSGADDTSMQLVAEKNNQGEVVWNILFVGMPYKYDNSGQNRNFVTIDFILDGDKSTKVSHVAELYNENGAVKFKSDAIESIYNMSRKGKTLYIRTRLSNDKVGLVAKYSLIGFIEADKKADELVASHIKGTSNPFSAQSNDDPFRG